MFKLVCEAIIVVSTAAACVAFLWFIGLEARDWLRKRKLKICWLSLAVVISLAALIFTFVVTMLIKSPTFPIFSVVTGLFLTAILVPLLGTIVVSTEHPGQRPVSDILKNVVRSSLVVRN